MLKRLTAVSAGLCLTLAIVAGPAHAQQRITIGTNPQGSAYYTVGGGIAKVISEELGRQAIPQPYAGASVYLPLVASGEVTMGLSSSLDSGRVYRGDDGRPLKQLRALARVWPLQYAYMVRGDSDIHAIQDLAGKRVVVDMRANAALGAANKAMLAAGGLTENDVEVITVGGLPQGVEGLTERRLDATAIAIGIPLTLQANASIPGGIRYVNLTGEDATDEVLAKHSPGLYTVRVEPAANRPGIPEPITVTAFDVFLVVNEDLGDEDVANILGALHSKFDTLREDYPALRSATADELGSPSNTLPYHPAAIQFFKDKGMWSEANDQNEQQFIN